MKRYSSFECSGSEDKLQNCTHHGPYPYQCNSHDYAGVICVLEEEGVLQCVYRVDIHYYNVADRTILNLNITLLAFMILISVMLVIILSLLLRCTLRRFRKHSVPGGNSQESEEGGTCRPNNHVTRTRLDHDMPYALLPTAIAPPSYADTILADQTVQQSDGLHHIVPSPEPQPEAEHETDSSSSANQFNLIVDETDTYTSTDQHS